MDIGLSTACFFPTETEKSLPHIKSLGFSEIEVFFNAEQELCPDFCRALRASADALGLRVVSVHPHCSAYESFFLLSSYARRREDGLALYTRIAQAGACLGARSVVFHGLSAAHAEHAGLDLPAYVDTLRALVGICKGEGLALAQENVSWCESRDPAFLQRLAEDIPDEFFRFTLDLKQAARAGFSLEAYLSVMAGRLQNVHLSDQSGQESCLLPPAGAVDFAALFARVQAEGAPHLLLEVYSSCYKSIEELGAAGAHLRSQLPLTV